MASLLADRKGYLLIQFYYRRKIYREYLNLRDTRDNRRDASRFRKDLEYALRHPEFDYSKWFPNGRHLKDFAPARKDSPTVAAYYRRWLDTLEVSKATRYDYECLGRVFLDRTKLGAILLNDVTVTDIREVIKDTVAAEKPRRATMILQRLRSMFDAAMDDELLDRNPARRIRNPRNRKRREAVEPFTMAEQVAILNAAQGQDRNLITVLLGTGARPGEVLALWRRGIDLKTMKIVINGSLSRYGEGPTKTAGSTRVINLTDEVAPVIAALRAQSEVPRLHGPLFANQSGGHLNFVNWRQSQLETSSQRCWCRVPQPVCLPAHVRDSHARSRSRPGLCRAADGSYQFSDGASPLRTLVERSKDSGGKARRWSDQSLIKRAGPCVKHRGKSGIGPCYS
jgi:integrase